MSGITTTQAAFHPMRGHVMDGCRVLMECGQTFTVRGVMAGWEVRDQADIPVFGPSRSAVDVAHFIAGHAG